MLYYSMEAFSGGDWGCIQRSPGSWTEKINRRWIGTDERMGSEWYGRCHSSITVPAQTADSSRKRGSRDLNRREGEEAGVFQ